jgi:di/tricarboxylate transporter
VRARHTAHAIAAFLAGAAIVALVLALILPVPPTGIDNFFNLVQLMLLTLGAPILFAWAWGPGPLGMTGLLAAIAIPLASIATLVLGFFRSKSYSALVIAAAVWSAFGGFSVFVAVTGSI